jgi:sugar phosphate isomerase/epimerase
MTIGLSTYAYFWQASDRVEKPLDLPDMLAATAEAGVGVFQICDYPAVAELDPGQLRALRAQAERAGVQLELGTRGVGPAELTTYLDLAQALDATTVRSMLYTATHRPTPDEAVALLREAVPAYEQAGVNLALETYEQVPTRVLVDVVRQVDSPRLGICADPANCVAALELPADVVDRVAPYVLNMHVKDFTFTRQAGWVGFNLIGAPLGEGLLDYDAMVERIDPNSRTINQVIEHWLPWQGGPETTCAVEKQWTEHNLHYLRSKQP